MCEHVKEMAEDSIRSSSLFPIEVEEHIRSCTACSQHVALATLVASTGRPPVQMPPVELSHRIASMTYAKQSAWQKVYVKPGVFVPAIGAVVAAGWLLSGLGGGKEVAVINTNLTAVVAPATVSSAHPEDASDIDIDHQPASKPSARIAAVVPVKRPVMQTKQRLDLTLVSDKVTGQLDGKPEVSISILQKPQAISSGVRSSDLASASAGASRIPDITAETDHSIDVQTPVSARHSVGRASLVLASADEEADQNELRASFQSQLNQQSDEFRTSVIPGAQHSGDSSRINVVNAPVVTGGK